MSYVANDEVPLVVSMYQFHRHTPVTHERREPDRHGMNRTQPSPRHLNIQLTYNVTLSYTLVLPTNCTEQSISQGHRSIGTFGRARTLAINYKIIASYESILLSLA